MVSGAQEDKCINCAFWSMCSSSMHFLKPTYSDNVACEYFEREK